MPEVKETRVGHRHLLADDGKVSIDRIYLAECDVSDNDRRSVTHAFVKESVAT